ncbi:hypothetical protein GCM10023210_13630 [Chryseobacterium ginsengisoli]|uniref:Uncharacterized protein n=1 Tax=Chryseobacterium ginsengisoli TaxID=363853 RepID=A0ABP9M4K5_9FLAO
MSNQLPPIPEGFGLPFYYATLFNIEVAFLVEREKVVKYLENTGLIAADFDGKALVSFNFQNYTGQFPNGASTTQEIELNIVSYPESQKDNVTFVTAEEYLRGEEQTKLMGHKRVHVPCDADMAIKAGIELFGEPKFKTTFTINLPSLNVPGQNTWTVACNDPDNSEETIFTCEADVADLIPEISAFSPITEYGKFDDKLIGCRWNILQPTNLHFLNSEESKKRVTMKYGNSSHQMREDMEILIGDTPAFAVRTSMSAPAAIQTRAYYI